MVVSDILKDPSKIESLSNEEKTNLYMNLKTRKEEMRKLKIQIEARKEVLEKKKEEIQNELFAEANVSSMDDLITYVKQLQADFTKALEEEATLVSEAMAKLKM